MSARAFHLVIDARPRGMRGPLAAEVVLGKSMLDHLLEVADELAPSTEPVIIHAREEEHGRLRELAGRSVRRGVQFVCGPPRADAAVLRTDRYYDAGRLKRGLRRGPIAGIGRALAARPAGDACTRRRRADPAPIVSAARKVLGFPAGRAPGGMAAADVGPAERRDACAARA